VLPGATEISHLSGATPEIQTKQPLTGGLMDDKHPGDRRFWGWPGVRNLAYAYLVLGPLLLAWFVFVYAGADYVTRLHGYRAPLYFAWELVIPFVPATVLVYNSLHLVYLIAPFILRTRAEMNAMAAAWAIITAVGGLVFLTVPFEVGYREMSASTLGPWRMMYRLADQANLTFNSLPSLHVAWSLLSLDVYSRKAGRLGKLLLWVWGGAMMLSTLLTHFHHVADVVAGVLLAMFGSRVVYSWLQRRFQQHDSARIGSVG
jgi:membrane-associated phospholipid phosphatase